MHPGKQNEKNARPSNLVGGVAASSEYYQEILPNPTDMLMARSIYFAA
ncbi:MAG: hypothetical protein ICV63_17490 [Coleofasciculus sp. Co-bin14]|nr:hypothetical protein [Coleofasciculus sp. Co-bin14]